MFIQVTRVDDEATIYVNINNIRCVQDQKDICAIIFSENHFMWVTESADDVMDKISRALRTEIKK